MINIFKLFKSIGQIKKFFGQTKELLKIANEKINQLFSDIKAHPQKYIIIALTLGLVLMSLLYLKDHLKPKMPVPNNLYSISLENPKIIQIKSEMDGTVVYFNEKISRFIKRPGLITTFVLNEELIGLDSAILNQKIEELRQKFPEIKGPKDITANEIIVSPDENELIQLETQINILRIRLDKLRINTSELENKYYQAQSLFDQRVITQTAYDDASNAYFSSMKELDSTQAELNGLERLYQQKSSPEHRKTIIITTRTNDTGAEDIIQKWLALQNKQIQELFLQKEKLKIKSTGEYTLKRVLVKIGQKIKKGDVVLEVVDSNSLIARVNLKKEDVKLIKEGKAKLYFVNQSTATKLEIQSYELASNKLSFKLEGKEMITNYKISKVLVERDQ